jgi:hypothetical protein
VTPQTGEYTDKRGRKWYCVAQQKLSRMICDCDDGSYTIASFKTFTIWGWKPSLPGKVGSSPVTKTVHHGSTKG